MQTVTQVLGEGDAITIDVPDLNDPNINMVIRGLCDCNALFLGQYREPNGKDHDLYYLPHEDTFLYSDIHDDRPDGLKYNIGVGEYSSLGGVNSQNGFWLLEEGKGHPYGEAFRRWTLLHPLRQAKSPVPGMIFSCVPSLRYDAVDKSRYVNLGDEEGEFNPALLQDDGSLIWGDFDQPISLLTPIPRFLYLQQVRAIQIEEDTFDIPSDLGSGDKWEAWWNSLPWAVGQTPADHRRQFDETFGILTDEEVL